MYRCFGVTASVVLLLSGCASSATRDVSVAPQPIATQRDAVIVSPLPQAREELKPQVQASREPERPQRSLPPAQRIEPQKVEPQQHEQPKSQRIEPVIPDLEIARLLVRMSQAGYSGNCPCPWNTDRAGRRCGARSAYSRPGGRSPLCSETDVTPYMIAAYRATLASR